MIDLTFRQYLKESGYSLMQYQEEVYNTCLAKSDKYYNIDVYFKDDIEKGFNENIPTEQLADELCENFDEFMEENLVESTEEKKETDDGLTDGETFTEWKENVFKYIDKRVDVDKIKELGTYIKDFIKQEYDNGEPSWFNVAESVVNYARIKFPDAVKPRESNAFSITEGLKEDGIVPPKSLEEYYEEVLEEFKPESKEMKDIAYYVTNFFYQRIPYFYGNKWEKVVPYSVDRLERIKQEIPDDEEDWAYYFTVERAIKNSKPENRIAWIDKLIKQQEDKEKAAEERKRQAHLNSEHHQRMMNDPGYRGPDGTWSLGT